MTRLTAQSQGDHAAFQQRDLSGTDYIYIRVDGIHLRIRLNEAMAAVLVAVGVRADAPRNWSLWPTARNTDESVHEQDSPVLNDDGSSDRQLGLTGHGDFLPSVIIASR
uniref:transposase n=1 Tax=Streptomyces gelaticus TaxID=285446 RepID=UPI0027E569D8|nr:transposase [Streptomyces gelaticus]